MEVVLLIMLISAAVLALYQIGSIFYLIKLDKPAKDIPKILNISFVIPHRNEDRLDKFQAHLLDILTGFDAYELIWVDDHSAQSKLDHTKDGVYLKLDNAAGKKAAIRHGTKAATFQRVVTLDADVRLSHDLVNELAIWDSDAMIFPVITEGNVWVCAESYALAGLTIGTAKMKRALMANGACLAFNKSLYLELSVSGSKYASGDDMFLLQALKKNRCKIDTIKNKKAFVRAKAPETIKSFIDQRVRWASKSMAIKDLDIITFGVFAIIYNLTFLTALSLMLCSHYNPIFIGIFAFKSIIDISLLFLVASRFGRKQYPAIYLLMTIVYPIYVVLMSLVSLFYRPKWKGRNLTHV